MSIKDFPLMPQDVLDTVLSKGEGFIEELRKITSKGKDFGRCYCSMGADIYTQIRVVGNVITIVRSGKTADQSKLEPKETLTHVLKPF